ISGRVEPVAPAPRSIRRAEMVINDRARRQDAAPAAPLQAEAQIDVLVITLERFIQQSDFLKSRAAVERGDARRGKNIESRAVYAVTRGARQAFYAAACDGVNVACGIDVVRRIGQQR